MAFGRPIHRRLACARGARDACARENGWRAGTGGRQTAGERGGVRGPHTRIDGITRVRALRAQYV
jgi:hypothetical protein